MFTIKVMTNELGGVQSLGAPLRCITTVLQRKKQHEYETSDMTKGQQKLMLSLLCMTIAQQPMCKSSTKIEY